MAADGSIKIEITGDSSELDKELQNVGKAAKQTGDDVKTAGKDADNAGRQAEKAGKKTKAAGDKAKEAGEKAKEAGDGLGKGGEGGTRFGNLIAAGAKKAVAALAAVKVAQIAKDIGATIVEIGSEFETGMAQVGTIADKKVKSLDALRSEILSLSSATGVSASELASSAYNAISAGVNTADAVKVAGQASKLATAGFTGTESALSVLTTAMNAYSLSQEDVSHISDSLISTQNLGVTTIDQLASSMGRAIATASAYGVDLENLEAGYISLTKAGISTDESTTYLSSMFTELGDAGSDVAGVLEKQTGKSFGQLMNDGASLADVLSILNDSVDGNSEALMNLWGSQEAGKAANAIVNQGLDTFNDNLQQVQDSAGLTEDAYAQMANTFAYQSDVVKTNAANLGAQIFGSLSEGLTGATTTLATGLQTLNAAFASSGPSALAAVIPTFVGQMTSAGIQMISGLVTGIGRALPTVIPMAIQVVTQFATSLISGLPMLTSGAVTLLSGLAQGLVNGIPLILTAIPQIITGIFNGLASAAPTLIEGGLYIVAQLANGIIDAIPQILAAIPKVLSAIISGIGSLAGSIGSAFIDVFTNGIDAGSEPAVAAAQTSGTEVANAAANGLSAGNDVSSAGAKMANSYIQGLTSAGFDAATAASIVTNSAETGLTGADTGTAMTAGAQLGTDYATGLSASGSTVSTAAASVASSAASAAQTDTSGMQAAGAASGNAFSSGFKAAASTASNAGKSVSQQAAKAITATKPQYAKTGQMLAQALATGLKQKTSLVRSNAKSIASAGCKAAHSTRSQWVATGGYLASGIARGITSKSSVIQSAATNAVSKALEAAKAEAGVQSPSTVWRDKLGQWLPAGAAKGIEKGAPKMIDTTAWLMDKTVFSAQSKLAQMRTTAAQALQERSNRDGRAIYNSYVTNQYGGTQTHNGGDTNVTYAPTFQSPKALDRKELDRKAKQDARRLKRYA